jgi:hypothetical protein
MELVVLAISVSMMWNLGQKERLYVYTVLFFITENIILVASRAACDVNRVPFDEMKRRQVS